MPLWRMLREDEPNVFSPIVVDEGPPVAYLDWHDGYPDDFSGWGDEEAQFITNKQLELQQADEPLHRSHASTWVPPG